MKIKITETFSDWFKETIIDLNQELYSSYKLVALGNNLVWTLMCYNEKGIEVRRYTLSPIGDKLLKKIIERLNITDIEENRYCKVPINT